MEFNEIPEVDGIIADGDYKYIVAEISNAGETKRIVRCALFDRTMEPRLEHQDIVRTLYGLPGKRNVLGGGWLLIEGTSAILSDTSQTYGDEPNREETATILRRALPNHQVEVRD